MPTENENKVDSLVDVGEADEKATLAENEVFTFKI